jgi:outer membrane protein OmpA-like peptidoglycan-associated protein
LLHGRRREQAPVQQEREQRQQRQEERRREQLQELRQREQQQERRQERRQEQRDERATDRREGPRGAFGDRRRIEELRALRRERVEQGGRRTIIEEQDRTIVREGGRTIIRHDETDRFRRAYRDAEIRRERRGDTEVTIVRRPNGVEIVTIRDRDGNLLRRVRREPGGRQIILFENEVPGRRNRTVFEEVIVLPPPQIVIPREQYIVEVEGASQEELYEAFTAPPVERVERTYTLDQVRQSPDLRERVRRVDVDTVTFDFGSWELSEEQARALTGVGEALRRAIEQNPSEVFLIEGHTDAVGSEIDNLTLSDRRAETVATILTEMYGVPAENLTTQGYGEQYLKINTQEPERENRRVTIRRITPLLRNEAQR